MMMSLSRAVMLCLLVTSSRGGDVMTPSTTASLLLRRLAESQVTEQEADVAVATTTQATPRMAKPEMYSLHVTSRIEYRFANTLITSRLANPANKSQEIFFSVVLPETAFISKFIMEIKGVSYEAYVKEKKEAKRDYETAVASGLGAAHIALSARDSNRFTVSVNIEPMSKVTFNLTYEELLTRRLGAYNHVINLDPGQIVRDLTVDVFIRESRNITILRVPELRSGNEVDANELTKANPLAKIDRKSATEAHISFSPTVEQQKALGQVKAQGDEQMGEGEGKRQEGLGGQFVVQYDVNRDPQAGEVLINNGFFVHFFAPADLPPLRKHALFVLDVSGSMEGRKIEQLKEAMDAILDDLNEGDYFNIIEFSYSVTVHNLDSTAASAVFSPHNSYYDDDKPTPHPGPTPAFPATPEYVAKAKEIVKKMRAGGGTNIYDTLKTVIRVAHSGLENVTNTNATSAQKREPIIVFLTDGEPTVGETRLAKIFNVVNELNSNPEAAIFSLAFGDDADLDFLKRLSLKNSGFARKIYEASDASLQLRDFYRQIASPLLANVTFNYIPEHVVEEATTKVHFHTLFSGSELVVAGKLRTNPNTTSYFNVVDGVISGEASTGSSSLSSFPTVPIDFTPTAPKEEATPLERLWAYLTIKQLLEKDDSSRDDDSDVPEVEVHGVNGTLSPRREALSLALKYSFVTPLTSLVVVKPNETKSTGSEAIDPVDGDSQNKFASFSGNFGPVDRLGAAGGVSLPLSGPISFQSFARPAVQSYAPQGLSAGYPGPPQFNAPLSTRMTSRYPYLSTTPSYPRPSADKWPSAQEESFVAEEEVAENEDIALSEAPVMKLSTTTSEPSSTSEAAKLSTVSEESSSISSTSTTELKEASSTTASISSSSTTVLKEASSTPSSHDAEESSSVTPMAVQVPTLIALEALDWLKAVRKDNDVTLPFGANGTNAVYQLDLGNDTLTAPAPCKTLTGAQGRCLHLHQCALNVFKETIFSYEGYFCKIDNYAGACCPYDVTARPLTTVTLAHDVTETSHDVTSPSSDVTPTTSSETATAK